MTVLQCVAMCAMSWKVLNHVQEIQNTERLSSFWHNSQAANLRAKAKQKAKAKRCSKGGNMEQGGAFFQ